MSETQALQKIEPMPADIEPRHAGPLDMEPIAFQAGLDRRKMNRNALMEWIRSALVENIDFGRIPTKRGPSKPSLFKPGAEKICGMLGIITTFPTLAEYEQASLKGIEIKSVVLRCALLDSRGIIVAEGVGARSLAQDYGDLNKALKMAEKSAHIDATLRMAGLSEVFTQDIEDMPKNRDIEPDKPANANAGTPRGTQQQPKPAQATEEQRQRWIAALKLRGEWALGYCRDKGWLLPDSGPPDDMVPGEPIEMLDARHVPTTKKAAEAILAELDALIPADQRPKAQEASRTAKVPQDFAEPFWRIICPIPYKGQRKSDYDKQPDTILDLYQAAKAGDEGARKRLWGFAERWKPEPRQYNGKTYQPSDADKLFRKALDEFLDWEKAKHATDTAS